MYTNIYFDHYKSYTQDEVNELRDIKRCNVIIGKNNSGKSSLLDVIAASVDEEYFRRNFNSIRNIELDYKLMKEHLYYIFSDRRSLNGVYDPNEFARKEIGQIYRVRLNKIRDNRFSYYMTEAGNDHFYGSVFGNKWRELAEDILKIESPCAFRRILADRDISPEKESADDFLEEDGKGATNLIRRYITFSKYNEDLVEEMLLTYLNQIMGPDVSFSDIKIQQINDGDDALWEIFLTEKGEYGRFALSESGSGLKTIILVLINLIIIPSLEKYSKCKNIVFGFEELENNLHPALQRRLFEFLYNFSIENNIYIFLTTHSHIAINTFFDKPEASIYHVIKTGKRSIVRKIENYIDKVEILNDLDVKASDLLQSNGIIWVEGPSDRIYIKKWLEIICNNKYVEGRDYQFMYYGGRLLSHYSADQENDLISILMTNRNAAIVMDSDKTNRQSKINLTKQRILKEFEKFGMFAWITKGKEIENYLSAELINNVFASELDECGQYSKFEKYIHDIFPLFLNSKVEFAKKVCEQLTKADLADKMDLKKQVTELYKSIEKWNS